MHVKETWAGNKSNRFNLGIVKMLKRESSYRSGNNKEIIGKKSIPQETFESSD